MTIREVIPLAKIEAHLQHKFPKYNWQLILIANRDAYQLFITQPGRDDNYSAIIDALLMYGLVTTQQVNREFRKIARQLITMMENTPPVVLGEGGEGKSD